MNYSTINTKELACNFLKVASAIAEEYDKNDYTEVVLLGRDCWPLFPLLEKIGVPTRYFHWSRLQQDDKSTIKQWKREIPSRCLVIDSGFYGSILREIAKVDPWAGHSFRLICRHYHPNYDPIPQINLGEGDNLDNRGTFNNTVADQLELLPKLTDRCVGYNIRGDALFYDPAKHKKVERDRDQEVEINPKEVINLNQALCKDMKVSAAKWATFTGQTQASRRSSLLRVNVKYLLRLFK